MGDGSLVIRVRYADTDRMGVVYYANYYIWFEVGRTEILRSWGQDYKSLEERGILLPVIESSAQYHAPARYDELLTVRTTLEHYRGARVAFNYKVENQNGALLVSGRTHHALTNLALRPIRAPADLATLLNHFLLNEPYPQSL
mgnify:CR=1 FL=1